MYINILFLATEKVYKSWKINRIICNYRCKVFVFRIIFVAINLWSYIW